MDRYTTLDNQKIALLVQLDIAKAYDTVNPKILLQKVINEINPDAVLKQMLRNYLFERQVATFANGILSRFGTVEIGIPQGGVLPPLLFAYYLSGLQFLDLYGKLVMYADDAQLLYSLTPNQFNTIQEYIKDDLRKVEDFFTTLQMKLQGCEEVFQTKTTIAKFGTL